MASPETNEFLRLVTEILPDDLTHGDVLEIGSYDVNGQARGHFSRARSFVGVDICEGPGVDVVGFGHELTFPDGCFDVGLSTSALEHDPNFRLTFANLVRMTKGGGAIVVTCAGPGFPEHGTSRTGLSLSPGTVSVGSDYYRNVSERDLRATVDFAGEFSTWKFWYLRGSWDLLLLAYRRPDEGASVGATPMPTDAQIRELESLLPFAHRVARFPFRMLHFVLPESVHARVAGIIWHRLALVQERFLTGRFTRRVGHPS